MTADAALLAAKDAMQDLRARFNRSTDSDVREAILGDTYALLDRMVTMPATTLAGAAAKLRIVIEPEFGLPDVEHDTYLPMLRDVLAVVERLAGEARS